jgi:hypothetical protein
LVWALTLELVRKLRFSSRFLITDVMARTGCRNILLDRDAAGWFRTQKDVEADKDFILSKKEIDSYLLDERTLAHALNVTEKAVAQRLRSAKGAGKEKLEDVIRTFGLRSTPEIKQIIARHLVSVPNDFIKIFEIITGNTNIKGAR